ncbi:MAG TPA: response regulator [Gemmatimonadales bacterium]|nr:response regulator [Gemmatimonadales bacterium]
MRAPDARATGPAARPKALVVDDDPAMVRLLSAILDRAGFQALAAPDGVQGFALAVREKPCLVLLDLHLPAGGGISLLERYRMLRGTRGIPVLMITADHTEGLAETALAKGAQGFVLKPVDPEQLEGMLKPFLPEG